jgi:hypothetical protein
MCRIKLNSHVANPLELVDPVYDLVEHISDNDGLSTSACVLPSRFDRSLLRSFGVCVQFREDVELARAAEVDTEPIFIGQSGSSISPEIVARP